MSSNVGGAPTPKPQPMNDAAVKKQLDNMVSFIKKEAEEKAAEIAVKAEEEFTLEKARLVQAQKLKIMKEFERREKQVEIQKKIAFSNELNKSRLQVLKAREEGIKKLFDQAKAKLVELSAKKESYVPLLKKLILQGLATMCEPHVVLRVRPEDKELIKGLLKEIREEYCKKTSMKLDDFELEIDSEHALASGPSATNTINTCAGGIVLSTPGGSIMLNNTLDTRLQVAYDISLPHIRHTLFSHSGATLLGGR